MLVIAAGLACHRACCSRKQNIFRHRSHSTSSSFDTDTDTDTSIGRTTPSRTSSGKSSFIDFEDQKLHKALLDDTVERESGADDDDDDDDDDDGEEGSAQSDEILKRANLVRADV